MQTENWSDFSREMTLICEAYDRKHSKDIDDAYWSALGKMQFRDFKRCAQYAREKAGQDGFDRLPKPGKFWGFIEELRRAEKPQSEGGQKDHRLSHEQHIAFIRRAAINAAKRETMPIFKGTISRNVPERFQAEYDAKWKGWDETLGQMDDDYWMPRAEEFMKQWNVNKADVLDFAGALKKLA